jgi:hypothetical protein
VLLCVAAASVATVARYPAALADLGDTARGNAAQPYTDREVAGGNAAVPSQRALYEARARIARDGTYEVVTGERLDTWPPLAPEHTATFARSFLVPRREAAGGEWVLCFNCDLARYPGEVVWRDEQGNALLRRSR